MSALIRSLLVRFHALLRRSTVDRELDEELEQHLERETAQNLARGMNERDATDAARRDLGNLTAHREAAWEAFGWTWLEQLGQDVRYGVRVLLRDRGFTIVTILILALGIGASTALFSAINGILLRPLPYRQPDRLVAAWESSPNKLSARAGTSASAFTVWAERSRTFDGFAAYRSWGFDLTGAADPERIRGARVSGNLFSLLGAPPLLGRTLVPEDGLPGRQQVVLLSEELWQRRFGTDARILGTSLVLDGDSYTVVGVLPAGFTLPEAELWVPLTFAPYEIDQRGDRPLSVIGRLKPGTDITAAREEMQAIARAFEREFPTSNAGWSVAMASLQEDLTGAARTPLVLLFVAAFCVLLVACANVTNLLLARFTARRREIALRAALGASRLRITRQLVTEITLIVTAAGTLGLLMTLICTTLLAHVDLAWLPRNREIRADPFVLAFGFLVSLATAAGLALISTLDALRLDASSAIKAGALHPHTRQSRVPWRDVPVVGQVAMALLLLIGGGLLLRSFQRAQSVDFGFSPDNILSMTISLPSSRYPTPEGKAAFFEELRRRSAALPGVRSSGLVSHLPLGGGALNSDFTTDAPAQNSPAALPAAHLVNVTLGYFETLSIPVRRGRTFAESDRADGNLVVIIDDALARRFWPQGDAVGRRLRLGATLGADSAWREVVGIVGSVRSISPEKEAEPTIYVPHSQNPWPTMGLVIRTAGTPEPITKAAIGELRALDPNQPVYNVRPLDEVVGRTLAGRRVQTLLMTSSAAVAFLLAIIGVYGMMAYSVAQRTREVGIRVALGASPRGIVWLCLRRGLSRIGVGVLIGAAAAFVGARFLGAVLFDLEPWDPITFLGALVLLGSAGLLACYVPAARAARSDPITALRLD